MANARDFCGLKGIRSEHFHNEVVQLLQQDYRASFCFLFSFLGAMTLDAASSSI